MKLRYALILVGMLAVPRLFAATVTTIDGYGPYQTGVGGEFTLQTSDSIMNAIANSYYSDARNQYGSGTSFQTFCVEGREYIYPNTTAEVVFNSVSVFTGNPLSKGAALLYSMFASGNWASGIGYSYSGGYGSTAAARWGGTGSSADLLQKAIWALMGGQESQVFDSSNPYEAWVASANGLGSWANAMAAASTGEDGVYILNMWVPGKVGQQGYAMQDQLVWAGNNAIPNVVPDGGLTVMLLGMGLTGLGFVSRRIRS